MVAVELWFTRFVFWMKEETFPFCFDLMSTLYSVCNVGKHGVVYQVGSKVSRRWHSSWKKYYVSSQPSSYILCFLLFLNAFHLFPPINDKKRRKCKRCRSRIAYRKRVEKREKWTAMPSPIMSCRKENLEVNIEDQKEEGVVI